MSYVDYALTSLHNTLQMSITSDEVNYLVYRYLVEAGLAHAQFAFQAETQVHRLGFKGVRPGALVALLQKGLLFSEVEAHLGDDGVEKRCTAPYTLFGHECRLVEERDHKRDEPTDLNLQLSRHDILPREKRPDLHSLKNTSLKTTDTHVPHSPLKNTEPTDMMDVDEDLSRDIPSEKIRMFKGHTHEVPPI